jgi:hypothetical protein
MGLFSGSGLIEGTVSILRRPPSTQFVQTLAFFPVTAGAAPPFSGEPPEGSLNDRNTTGASPDGSFSMKLAPGHYQICVRSLPFVVEGKKMILEPENRFAHWPVAKAIEVKKSTTRHLNLKVEFPEGLGKFGDKSTNAPAASSGLELESEDAGSPDDLYKSMIAAAEAKNWVEMERCGMQCASELARSIRSRPQSARDAMRVWEQMIQHEMHGGAPERALVVADRANAAAEESVELAPLALLCIRYKIEILARLGRKQEASMLVATVRKLAAEQGLSGPFIDRIEQLRLELGL